jgi:acyl-CoA thioesterase
MLNKDSYSQWLGINILTIEFGSCVLEMVVRGDMLNGFKIGHGATTYGLSDSAFAFASNSYGNHAVSIETSISHIKPIFEGDKLTATVVEKSRGKTIGVYEVVVINQKNIMVSLFKGTVFIKDTLWK